MSVMDPDLHRAGQGCRGGPGGGKRVPGGAVRAQAALGEAESSDAVRRLRE